MHGAAIVGVPSSDAELRPATQAHPKIRSLERVRVVIVRPGALRVELIPEQVVVKTVPSPRHRDVTMGGVEISTIGAETQFGSLRGSASGEYLDDAGHGIGAIKR